MSKTYCRLDNGVAVRYVAAFPLDSTAKVSDNLYYVGVGVICKVGNQPYNGPTRLKFYTTRYLYYGYRNKKSTNRRGTFEKIKR